MDSDAAVAACRRLFLGFPIARRLSAPSASVRPAQRPAPRPTGPALHLEGDSGPEPSTRARGILKTEAPELLARNCVVASIPPVSG
jgi:hypothetical protein